MKFLIFFLCIFCLFSLSKKEIPAFTHQSQNCRVEHLAFLEEVSGSSIWGIENITPTMVYVSDHEISPQKKNSLKVFAGFSEMRNGFRCPTIFFSGCRSHEAIYS